MLPHFKSKNIAYFTIKFIYLWEFAQRGIVILASHATDTVCKIKAAMKVIRGYWFSSIV